MFASNAVSQACSTYSHSGGSSSSHFLHHSLFIMAEVSEVGCCWYCAIHLAFGSSSLSAVSSTKDQNSGHSGFPEGINAGNSITSQSSPPLCAAALSTCAVKSLNPHRVITITMAPPGCSRCRGPDVYHSYTLSYISGELSASAASCSECGSSIISRSAPLPVTAPPTPIAK